MSQAASPKALVIHGWAVYAHPLFLAQVDALANEVDALRRKDPAHYKKKNATRRLAAICKLAFDIVPADPTRNDYRQGATLGKAYTHWFRAKFFQQYRLFFRYDLATHIIVFGWVNDSDTLRTYESDDDAYRVFRKMLDAGYPPDDWGQLLAQARIEAARLRDLADTTATAVQSD
ncbi:MAG: type II toxin-antitoxin system YhaV family toxin [Rhodanobacteraceae bacterium]